MFSQLPFTIDVVLEVINDYIQFSYAAQHWPSNGQFGSGDTHNQCRVGAWCENCVGGALSGPIYFFVSYVLTVCFRAIDRWIAASIVKSPKGFV